MKKRTARHVRHVTHTKSVWKQKVNPFIAWGIIGIIALAGVMTMLQQ